jgi:hydroxymethylpyrimidine/phosphomethylpyrimidine kinase
VGPRTDAPQTDPPSPTEDAPTAATHATSINYQLERQHATYPPPNFIPYFVRTSCTLCLRAASNKTIPYRTMKLPVALTIAGSDSGGGAGIQADLKTFAALGCHGTSALTAVTAQNTQGVSSYVELPLAMVREQIDRVVEDLQPHAAKTGMLASPDIIETVVRAVEEHKIPNLVVDPVMVAKGGHKLLQEEAVDALRTRLLPLAAVLTPNLPEAEVLLERTVRTREDRERAARDLVAMGCQAAIVKGGHGASDADDVYCSGQTLVWLPAERIETPNTHGSGCTFSAAIVAGLARGLDRDSAVREAKRFITEAIRHALELGHGHGPVNPMWRTGTTDLPGGEA